MRQTTAFIRSLILAITAPEHRKWAADDLVHDLAAGLTPHQIERAKRVALERIAQTEWFDYCRGHELPPDIPIRPDLVYRDCGWRGWRYWLGWDVDWDLLPDGLEWRPSKLARVGRKFRR